MPEPPVMVHVNAVAAQELPVTRPTVAACVDGLVLFKVKVRV